MSRIDRSVIQILYDPVKIYNKECSSEIGDLHAQYVKHGDGEAKRNIPQHTHPAETEHRNFPKHTSNKVRTIHSVFRRGSIIFLSLDGRIEFIYRILCFFVCFGF